jgi:hypothetical protein
VLGTVLDYLTQWLTWSLIKEFSLPNPQMLEPLHGISAYGFLAVELCVYF